MWGELTADSESAADELEDEAGESMKGQYLNYEWNLSHAACLLTDVPSHMTESLCAP